MSSRSRTILICGSPCVVVTVLWRAVPCRVMVKATECRGDCICASSPEDYRRVSGGERDKEGESTASRMGSSYEIAVEIRDSIIGEGIFGGSVRQ